MGSASGFGCLKLKFCIRKPVFKDKPQLTPLIRSGRTAHKVINDIICCLHEDNLTCVRATLSG
jgi:hypothetical protein